MLFSIWLSTKQHFLIHRRTFQLLKAPFYIQNQSQSTKDQNLRSHLAPVAAIAGRIHSKAKDSGNTGHNCSCLKMLPQWFMATLSPCYRQGHRCITMITTMSSETTDLPLRGKFPFKSLAILHLPANAAPHHAAPCRPRAVQSCYILAVTPCSVNLPAHTFWVSERCHCRTFRETAGGPSGLKHCICGMTLWKQCFSKSIKTKPSMYCKNTKLVQTKQTHHNLSEDIHAEPFWNWR